MLDVATSLPETVAAVDLGSNSFHMVVARASAGELVVVDRLREMVQLAYGLDKSKRLNRETRERALDCLQRFGQRVRHMPRQAVRAVGTDTLRSACNARDFLEDAEEALGHPIETITGMEEARLIHLGVSHSLAHPELRRLVIDIGGGSTELIVGESFRPHLMESLYVGCINVSRKYFGDGDLDSKRWRKAELAALREFEPIQHRFRDAGWEQAVGASGTIRSAHAIAQAAGWIDHGLTVKAMRKLRDAILKAGRTDRLRLAGLNPARRSVLPGGAVVLLAAFETLGIARLDPSDGALREGLLYDLVGRIREEEDVRARSVSALADRYHVDREQARRVESTALRLLAGVTQDWQLDDRQARQLLSWAAQLHEIGLDIAHQHYHKHGEYVVAQSDLYGFSREEQSLLATLVRSHRRKFPLAALRALPFGGAPRVERLAVILRLSALLHRSRSPDRLPEPRLAARKKTLKLRFPEGWLDAHALTRADLEQEASYLRTAGYKLEFR